jgi:hypothetical protein
VLKLEGRFAGTPDAVYERAAKLAVHEAPALASSRQLSTPSRQEARLHLARLAKDLIHHLRREQVRLGRGKRLLIPAAPAVPPSVPAAVRYQSSPADWQQPVWAELGFSIDKPQYCNYEVQPSAGGRNATLWARCDRDGDEQLAEFALELRIVREQGVDQVTVAPHITESQPDE